MRYKKFPPSAELSFIVECFFVWEDEAVGTLDVQTPPNGFCSMVFNYCKPYETYQNNSPRVEVPLAFVSGQFTSNYHLVLSEEIGMVGIVFKPTALHNIFAIRMSQLVNNRMPLSFLLGEQADQLLAEIKNATSDDDRIELLKNLTHQYAEQAKSNLSVIDEAVEYIDAQRGAISVEAVAAHFKISRRYLEKKVLEKIGVSPKFYARIKRFNTLSKMLAYGEKLDWQEMILESGLHDQSHLIKEFLEFNQMSPTEYYNKHNELIRFVKPS